MIHLKTLNEIQQIEHASKMVSEILYMCYDHIKPGIVTMELEDIAEKYCSDHDVRPSFKGYRGFPYCLCVSLNDEVVHGFPSERVIQAGDLVSVDCGVERNGYYGDAAFTKIIGSVPARVKKLVDTTKNCLREGIKRAVPNCRLHDISEAIQKTAMKQQFNVVKEYTGHGVGFDVHEDPLVPNYVSSGINYILKIGTVIAIEPMVTYSDASVRVGSNGWIVKTVSGKHAAHFEHTVAILEDGPRVLSRL